MDPTLILIAAFVGACVATLTCLLLSPGWRLVIAATLVIPQLYIPGLQFPVADGWLLLMAVVAVFDKRVVMPRFAVVYLSFMLFIVYSLAHLWSLYPFDFGAIMLTVRVLLYGVLICYAYSVALSEPALLRTALKWSTPWILLQAGLTCVFRFNTVLESSFLSSPLGQILVGPSARDLFTISPNNVLDPEKSGGLFVNGNVASMFGGVAAFLLFAAARQGWSKWYYGWAALAWASAIATGSKTGVSLAIILPLLCLLLSQVTSAKARFMLPPLVVAFSVLLFLLPSWLETTFPSFSDKSVNAYGTRSGIWDAAFILFKDSPLLGLGYGGWAESTKGIAAVNGFPPHNMVIAAWAVGGLCAAILLICLCASTVAWSMREMLRGVDPETRFAAACALSGFLWIYIHSMGDNTTFYGEPRTMILVVLLFGIVYLPGRMHQPADMKLSCLRM